MSADNLLSYTYIHTFTPPLTHSTHPKASAAALAFHCVLWDGSLQAKTRIILDREVIQQVVSLTTAVLATPLASAGKDSLLSSHEGGEKGRSSDPRHRSKAPKEDPSLARYPGTPLTPLRPSRMYYPLYLYTFLSNPISRLIPLPS